MGRADAGAGRLQAGRNRANPLCPCSRRVARHGRMDVAGAGRIDPAGVAPPFVGDRRARDRGAGYVVHRAVPCDRFDLGQADLGHLVGMGRADDVDARPAVPLCGLYCADQR